jgi:uncharacterized protein YndB with AHSA1/START domain
MKELVIERVLNAPVSIVWKAISDNSEMKKWYFQISSFVAKTGHEFTFDGGPPEKVYVHLCKVTEVINEKKLSYTWSYKGYHGESLVTWELFPEGSNTRIRLTHSGLETFPSIPDFARNNFEQGWNHIIGISLKKFVEKK